MKTTKTARETRWGVPYTLVTEYASRALVWAIDESDAIDRARAVLARGGYPAVAEFGVPTDASL